MELFDKKFKLRLLEKLSNGYGIFECECGNKKKIRRNAIREHGTTSCGCHRKLTMSKTGKLAKTHGMTNTWLFRYWSDSLFNKKDNYCEDWEDFNNFYLDIGSLLTKGKRILPIIDTEPISLFNFKIVTSNESKSIKTKKTSLEKYGVAHQTQNNEIKAKIAQTNLERYGNKCVLQSVEIKEKIKITNLEKYGFDHHTKTDQYKEKSRQRSIDNGQANFFDGKTGTQWAGELGLSASAMNHRIEKYGPELAISMPKYQSAIETVIENYLSEQQIKHTKQFKVEGLVADFYLSEHKLILECDGLYWHSEKKKEKNYHKDKKAWYTLHGYKSLFFREDEIENKLEIVKSIINNQIRKVSSIYARKCIIKELDIPTRKNFFNNNHLMGVGRGKAFGLYYNDELVCGLQFLTKSKLLNVERFCPKIGLSVIGGFTKLLKQAELLDKPGIVQTFIDKRYGDGSYLTQFGFTLESEHISFVWVKDSKSFHRMKFPGNSGYEHGYYKLWDCGQARYNKKSLVN